MAVKSLKQRIQEMIFEARKVVQNKKAQHAERKRVNALTKELLTVVKNPADNAAENIRKLVQQGANVNTFDMDKEKSLLHYAAEHNRMDMVKTLLECGCRYFINVNDSYGKTPAFYAIDNKNSEMLDYLLTNGITTERPLDFNYDSVLRHAVRSGDVKMAEICLKHGADVNDRVGETFILLDKYERTYPGPTPLADIVSGQEMFNSTQHGQKKFNEPMVKLLLEHNARTDLKDAYGHDALDKAASPRLHQMVASQRAKEISLKAIATKCTNSGME